MRPRPSKTGRAAGNPVHDDGRFFTLSCRPRATSRLDRRTPVVIDTDWLRNGHYRTRGTKYMLILTRRVGEAVMIGDEVTITVLGVKGGQVRLGINAPKRVAVHREEVYERIKREQQDGPGDPTQRTVEYAPI